jgi:hypothetical protein
MSVGFWAYPLQTILKILGEGLLPFLLITKNLSILDVPELSTYFQCDWFRLPTLSTYFQCGWIIRARTLLHAPIVLRDAEYLLHHFLEIIVDPKFQPKSVGRGAVVAESRFAKDCLA